MIGENSGCEIWGAIESGFGSDTCGLEVSLGIYRIFNLQREGFWKKVVRVWGRIGYGRDLLVVNNI